MSLEEKYGTKVLLLQTIKRATMLNVRKGFNHDVGSLYRLIVAEVSLC